MDPSFQALLSRLDHLSDQFGELRDGVQKAIQVADFDPEMALTRARKVLEYVIRDVYERRIKEPPGTRPLENLLQRLVKDGFFPDRLDAYANTIRKLGNVGTHTFGEKITVADVYQSLTQLMPILEWYFETECPEAVGQNPAQKPEPARAKPAAPTPARPESKVAVVPKGLRSFDANDADFFLDLLPGPRDKYGLPESIRFWKHRIETTDELTFTVGVIYGPSGCGKSSLVKAGLLPRLAGQVISIYVEATADDTEARLLKGLRKRCPVLPSDLDLIGTIAAMRQGQGQKTLIVLDQFEQWLHASRGGENSDLVQAIRQCDGEHVQCVVMVRDDFWMALTRFMDNLNIELLQGQNAAVVDLFDLIHARSVLLAFGWAFGRLKESLTKDQEAFLDQAIKGLSQEGRVISVRLALFAEMMKGKTWTSATLKEVGGAEGIGVTFLEETFSASTAPPEHRYHQKAGQAALKALLPESGTDIKGQMKSHDDLQEASGYEGRPKDFQDLIRILDGEIRLITPTDPEGNKGAENSSIQVQPGQKYYQLTHDYLVPSLRDWLTRKQKETRRGRAELLLADRAGVWNARPENRQLPSLWQWFSIRWFTQKMNWMPPQRKMMRKATRYHAVRVLVLAIVLVLIGWGSYEAHGTVQAHALRNSLLRAETAKVPSIIEEMAPYRAWIDPLLRDSNAEAKANQDAPKQLHASLALLPVDPSQVDYLYGRLLDAAPNEVPVIGDALASHKDEILDKLWAVLEVPEKGKEAQRLRAAAALAKYDPESERWAKVKEAVANDLVSVPAVYLALWMDSLRPVRSMLFSPLSEVYRNASRRETERTLATDILADYAGDDPQVLADLLMDADGKQFAVIYPKFKEQGKQALPVLTGEIDKKLPPELPSSDDSREKLAKRQANAAVALLMMDRPEKVWPLLKHSPDPRVRSYLIHRFGPLGADARAIVKRLDEEPDVTIKRALILSLGEYSEKEFSGDERKLLLPKLQEMYRKASDPGLHGSAEWLLRHWKQDEWLKQANEEWAKDKEQREKRLEGIRKELASRAALAPGAQTEAQPQWCVNGQGQTMVVIPGPVEFVMGSPPTEAGKQNYEPQHKKRIGRTFALAAKSVTMEQYRQFDRSYQIQAVSHRTADLPVMGTSWYQAAAYCIWLSKKEGIYEDQWCYETDAKGEVTKLKANYLSLTGYRLPTEAEMEYATRAGAVTSRYFGETEELLPKYAWYTKNSKQQTWPVGSLKPNDLGLFDVLGNAFTWCQESWQEYPSGKSEKAVDDEEDGLVIIGTSNRVLRGGSFYNQASNVRSANRYFYVPTPRTSDAGFRVARTLTP